MLVQPHGAASMTVDFVFGLGSIDRKFVSQQFYWTASEFCEVLDLYSLE